MRWKNIIVFSLLLGGCTTNPLSEFNIFEDSSIPYHTLISTKDKALLLSTCKNWLAQNGYSIQKEDGYFILAKKEEKNPLKIVMTGSKYYADLSFYNHGDSCEIIVSTFYLSHSIFGKKEFVSIETEFESLKMKIDSL